MRIITSIPPHYAAPDRLDYLTECVKSWRRCGFDPISLNRPDEAAAVERMGLLEVRVAATDEAWEPKRFGPSLGSVFDTAHPDDPLAVINADIYMLGEPGLGVKLAEICRKGVVVARRTDVSELGASTGEIAQAGHDLFAFVKSAIPKTASDSRVRSFQMGAPWWDYIVPAAASFETSAFRVREPFIIHRKHEDRWDMEIWHRLSGKARLVLDDLASDDFRAILEREDGEPLTAKACKEWLFDSPVFQTIDLPNDGSDPFFKVPPRLVERPARGKLISLRKFKAFVRRTRSRLAR